MSAAHTAAPLALEPLPMRAGHLPMAKVIELYMRHYDGNDSSRQHRLAWWQRMVGDVALQDLSDDHIAAALEDLARQPPRYFAGHDADGRPIYKAKPVSKGRTLAGGTVNRYGVALSAVITWAIRKRVAPKGYVHPCRSVERKPETSGRTRFLSDAERERLLAACRKSSWPRLYALVLLALTCGARKSELLGLRWSDVNLDEGTAHVATTKNGDPRLLMIVPAVRDELRRFKGSPSALVFCSPRASDRPFTFEPHFAAALKAANVKGFRFHDLRHSCASMLARAGATLLEIGDVLGHRQIAMTRRYSHLAIDHKSALLTRVMAEVK